MGLRPRVVVQRDQRRRIASLFRPRGKTCLRRFKGLGEISPAEFKQFIGKDMRVSRVEYAPKVDSQQILSFYLGGTRPSGRITSWRI